VLTPRPWSVLAAVVLVAVVGCAARSGPAGAGAPAAASGERWRAFWSARGVSPAPPEDFLDAPVQPLPQIVNATAGRLDDETAKKWVVADLRRGRGDAWASMHLRLDIANAGVLGPVGFNGTDEGITSSLAKGVVQIACPPALSRTAAAAVVAVPQELRMGAPRLGLTPFVIVFRYEHGDGACEQLFGDGHREALPQRRSPGVPSWQLDTGSLRDDPVVGALWYQADGYSCDPAEDSPIGALCGVVEGGSLPGERITVWN
jgi:hypothetical protein